MNWLCRIATLVTIVSVVVCYLFVDLPIMRHIWYQDTSLYGVGKYATIAGDAAMYLWSLAGLWVMYRWILSSTIPRRWSVIGFVACIIAGISVLVGLQYPKLVVALWTFGAMLLVLRHFTDPRVAAQWCLFAFTAIAGSGLLVNVLKVTFGRWRPRNYFRDGDWGFVWLALDDGRSFPSGHSCTAGAVAMCLYFMFPRYRLWWIALGVTVGITRILEKSHYPSDVIAGLYLGAVFTWWLRSEVRRRGWAKLYPVKPRGTDAPLPDTALKAGVNTP